MLVLIIEDDAGIAELLAESLAEQGYETSGAHTSAVALEYLQSHVPDLLILDYGLPDMNGREFIEALATEVHHLPPFIVATGQGDERVAVEMMKLGARDYIVKDVNFLNLLPEVIRRVDRELQNERKLQQVEEKLRRSEALHRALFEQASDAIFLGNERDEIVDVNRQACELLGYTREELLSMQVSDLQAPEVRGGKGSVVKRELEQYQGVIFEGLDLHRDGRRIPVEISTAGVTGLRGELTLSIVRDITKRKQAEKSLQLLDQAMQQSPVSVIITDTEGIIQYINPKFTQITGYSAEEAIGQNPRILKSGKQPPEFYREMWDTFTAGQEWRGEFRNKKKNGELYWEMASIVGVKDQSGNITHYVAVKEDITQRKQLEKETMHQERLAAVGQLSAGIAHDFNNILTSIIGFADLLQRNPNVPQDVHPDLIRIVKQGQRAAILTRQILDFSRQTVNEPQHLYLNAYLNETLKFIERTIPETIQIQFNYTGGECAINADPAQLQQIITNLAVNARDAMPDGGTLYFDLSCTSQALGETPPYPELEAGEWVRLTVRDTGSGIPAEVLPHIFEPFFTTKEVGRGTGLGLAQVYGLVQQHDGCITVDSRVGEGTMFALYFPALTDQIASKSDTYLEIPMGQDELVLLVEDQDVVREVTQAMLEALNYRVLTAKDGDEALTKYHTQANQIAMVLSDVVMPGMGGVALASALRAESPDVKIVLMTGYARDSGFATEAQEYITDWLQKPLSLHQLAQALGKLLG